ncbi:MAG: tRNA 5-methoxyuridine(34)/uridine 5-oxyacetic acid(34) synthase CmoB [Campylobacteraceae bacterium]|jgi:tRNA (mo5U34)-methyltransferase|nr:tRNA 5-methoxyuridine(34)/uridine 5-oxyacetic acid(34) synthase CmoB [Campylobacteraceae bacterium]
MKQRSQEQKEIVKKWKNIAPLIKLIENLPDVKSKISFSDIIEFKIEKLTDEEKAQIKECAVALSSWRKGPFLIDTLFIDSEWRSFIKYNLLKPHFDLKGKSVADIGCNNGYYLFRMLEERPKKLVGFDPTALFWLQFLFLNHFAKSEIVYELLGVEHLSLYGEKFDVLFCLGVLYHRSDPISTLKSLHQGLNENGELFLDTFMIDGSDEIALCPENRYSKISNVYFIPTYKTLENWCKRAGFSSVELLHIKKTELEEQRKTEWVLGESLEDFLDKNDSTKTIEGYPAPKRVYIKAKY